ncbi:MAG TPA: hypothetical protein VJY12_06440 [Dysgonamonadaceae bacterium]|jgi:hypothetical protein|nr:hypothetical protein [Bacteroidales bacterium]HKM45077.1 hypothetical protein [Dysgonamonadaceae bacterium]
MNKQKRFLLSLIIFVTLIGTSSAQNVGVDSPYGRYGYGVLSKPALGATESMGGISYGVRRGWSINPGNPASYSAVDTLNFTMEMGVSGQYSKLSDGLNNQSFQNGNFDYLAFQFPVYKNVGMSVGLLPYSKVGYDFGRDILSDEISYRETFSGSGGLSKIYGGIAYAPIKQLSVGANLSYLFGKITHSQDIPALGQTGEASNRLAANSFTIKNVMFDLGAQFTYPIDDRRSMTLGVVYTPSVKNETTVFSTDYLYSATGTQLLPSDTLYNQSFDLPETFGVGFSYSSINWLVGIDGTFQKWANAKYPDDLDNMTLGTRFNDKYSVALGAEYVADPVNRNFFQRVRFRGGLSYSNSYTNTKVYDPITSMSLGEHGYKEYGVNVGFGLPFRDMISGRISMVNLGFGYSIMDPEHKYMIKEEMFKVSVNININEFWFFKRQFD